MNHISGAVSWWRRNFDWNFLKCMNLKEKLRSLWKNIYQSLIPACCSWSISNATGYKAKRFIDSTYRVDYRFLIYGPQQSLLLTSPRGLSQASAAWGRVCGRWHRFPMELSKQIKRMINSRVHVNWTNSPRWTSGEFRRNFNWNPWDKAVLRSRK